MSRDKQIDEMAEFMTEGARPWAEDAEALYNAGYRKSEDVAREIFEEIEEILIDNSYQIPEEFYEFYDKRRVDKALAELKKKYTEGGK